MKANQFTPFDASYPALTDDGIFVEVTQLTAENQTTVPVRVEIYDRTRETNTSTGFFLGQGDQKSMAMLLPCKLSDLELRANFLGRVGVTIRASTSDRLYRANTDTMG